jgi:DNA-directed RNA polymerase specialized sigma24 family protein
MGLTTQEIADQLGLTQAAVLTRLFRARHKLRRALGATADGENE